MSAPIRRRRDGRYAIQLDPAVRTLIAATAEQFASTIEPDDPMARRLYPPAYPGGSDHAAEKEYRALVDDALVTHRRQSLSTMCDTAHAKALSEEGLHAWLSAVESIRLVIGTRLDVSEEMIPPDPADPGATDYALYDLFGQLQYLIVEVLADELPDEGRPVGSL
jgi:hypothetical protein